MALSNRIIYALLTLCIGTSFLVQAHGSNPALKLKIINKGDKQLTLAFIHADSDLPETSEIIKIKPARTFYTKLDHNKLRAICTHEAVYTRAIMKGWYNRAVQSSDNDSCFDVATLLQQRGNKKLLEITYKKEFGHPELTWKY